MKLVRLPRSVLWLACITALTVTSGAQAPVPGPNSALYETFSGGMPAAWSVVDGNSDGITWSTANASAYNMPSPFSGSTMVVDSNRNGSAYLDEQLITPAIDVAGCQAPVKMSFANGFRFYSGSGTEVGDVDVSADGGATWENLFRMSEANYGAETRTLTLAPYPRASSQLKARFHYYIARGDYWWLVDEVNVYCDCSGDTTPPVISATPAGGTFDTPPTVALSCQDTGCGCRRTHYTLDGSEPTVNSPAYTGPIDLPGGATLKYFSEDWNGNRAAAEETYTIAVPVAPVANAGSNQTVHQGAVVTLDGSASTDPDGKYPLTYAWGFLSKPDGSGAALSDSTIVNPTFIADLPGDYRLALTVTDQSGLSSAPSTVTVSTTNSAPAADAGDPQTVPLGTSVTLAGAATDPDGDSIASWHWTMTSKPEHSHATLANSDSSTPTFVADAPGEYVLQLVVKDQWGSASAPDSVTISTWNSPPVAEASASPQAVTVTGTVVDLNGTQSYDPDGDAFTYAWAFKSSPSSVAAIANPTQPQASFVADVHGDYVIELTVTDVWGDSRAATVTVSFDNLPPTADPGVNQSVEAGAAVSLDGAGSSDPNQDPITYAWSLLTKPAGSSAVLEGALSASPTFVADRAGVYTAQLVVSDGALSSEPKTVTVTAVASAIDVIQKLSDALAAVNLLDGSDFKNKNMRNTLTTKIAVVIEQIRQGQREEALDKLQNDVFAKLDGCGLAPDPNDWIIRCAAQARVRPLVEDAVRGLR
jgi:hypothetical protein